MNRVSIALLALTVSVLACRSPERKTLNLYPSPTSSEAIVVERVITTTPLPTSTPMIVVYTSTPVPPSVTKSKVNWLCVIAEEAVYLRPSPSTENYPIIQLENGQRVIEEGGRTGDWIFVSFGDKRGWASGKYLQPCK